MTASNETVKVWQIVLQGTTAKTDEHLVYLIGEDENTAKRVERDLAAAKPGEFVPIPVRFANQLDGVTMYIQPHLWGLWVVAPRILPAAALYGAR